MTRSDLNKLERTLPAYSQKEWAMARYAPDFGLEQHNQAGMAEENPHGTTNTKTGTQELTA